MNYTDHQRRHLADLMEEAIQIAWNYLERSGEIDDGDVCNQILLYQIESMLRQGVRSRLLLSNKAIRKYMEYKASRSLKAAG